jgi:hypothetical protein
MVVVEWDVEVVGDDHDGVDGRTDADGPYSPSSHTRTRTADFRAVRVKCADSVSVRADPCGFLHSKT